jgi:signal transduction histidine kinase
LEDNLSDITASTNKGQGIGLWLSRRLVELNNGELILYNEKKGRKGAIVTIKLTVVV